MLESNHTRIRKRSDLEIYSNLFAQKKRGETCCIQRVGEEADVTPRVRNLCILRNTPEIEGMGKK